MFIEDRVLLTALFALSWLAFAQPTAEHLNTAIRAVISSSRSDAYYQLLDRVFRALAIYFRVATVNQ